MSNRRRPWTDNGRLQGKGVVISESMVYGAAMPTLSITGLQTSSSGGLELGGCVDIDSTPSQLPSSGLAVSTVTTNGIGEEE